MTRDELIKTAIKTVIQYAEEQGVKLRRIDFKESKWIFVPDGAINYYTLPFGKDEEVKKELDKQCTALAIVVQPKVQESWEAFSKDFGTLNAKLNGNNYEAYAEGEIEGKRALNAQYIEE